MNTLPLNKIYPNPDQPRRHFSERKLSELAQSIEQNGLLEPLIVTEREKRFMIIAGERRFRACKLAGLAQVPVRVIEADDQKVAELALLENLQREDLNLIEEARGYQNLMDLGLTMEEVARKMGFQQTWRIRERTDLLRLSPQFQQMLINKMITPSQAYEMSRLPPQKQPQLYERIRRGQAGTYAKLRALVNALLVPPPEQIEFGPAADPRSREIGRKYDRMIDSLVCLVKTSFSKEDLKILKKVLRSSLEVNIEKIEYIVKDLNSIKKAMIEAQAANTARAA